MVFQTGNKRDHADIEMPVMTVHPEKMPFKLATRPEADFRLYQVQVQTHIIRKLPGVIGTPDIHGELTSHPELHTGIRSGGRPEQEIRFQCGLLSIHICR